MSASVLLQCSAGLYCDGAQPNRADVRAALNLLLTGDPATTPGLAKVLQAMPVGLPGDKRVLHPAIPL